MRTLRSWFLRLGGLFAKRSRELELAREIQSHLEMHMADNLKAGMTAEQARRQALLMLGGLEAMKETCRTQGTVLFLEHFALDLRFALRQLRKNPTFTGTALLVLALGMCASMAIFSFISEREIPPIHHDDLYQRS